MKGRDLTGDTLILAAVEERDMRALFYVCSMARDLDDARELIDALGLNSRRQRTSKRQRRDVACRQCGEVGVMAADQLCPTCYADDFRAKNGDTS